MCLFSGTVTVTASPAVTVRVTVKFLIAKGKLIRCKKRQECWQNFHKLGKLANCIRERV